MSAAGRTTWQPPIRRFPSIGSRSTRCTCAGEELAKRSTCVRLQWARSHRQRLENVSRSATTATRAASPTNRLGGARELRLHPFGD